MAEEKQSTSEKINAAELKPGMTVRIYQKIKELNSKGEEKERLQYFDGIIIAKKHGKEILLFACRRNTLLPAPSRILSAGYEEFGNNHSRCRPSPTRSRSARGQFQSGEEAAFYPCP